MQYVPPRLKPAADAFQWAHVLLGGEPYTRLWHFVGMWVFLIATVIHLYMARA